MGESVIPEATKILLPTFIALCLGALVGLERQVAQEESGGEKDFPGVRTFAFLALLGALAVLVGDALGPWLSVAIFLAAATFLVLRYSYDTSRHDDPGYTTEIAGLCIFAVGVLAQAGQLLVATVITIAMVALLRSKRAWHRASALLEPAELETLIRFLVITGIVLPLLPDDPVEGFYGVLRPRDVWRMVVLISGISFVGYALMRVRAGRSSHTIMGILGGFVSSTAAAITYSRSARESGQARPYESLVVLATSTAFVRMGIVLAIVAPNLLPRVALPLGAMFGVGMLLGFARRLPSSAAGDWGAYKNPLQLRLALTFAALYATILVLVAAAREHLGDQAIYGLSALGAVAGADAPSLSLARLAADGRLDLESASIAVVVVAIATTLAKSAIVVTPGRGAFAARVVPPLLLIAATGAAILVLS